MALKYWVDQAKPAEANTYACADCSRYGVPNVADTIVNINKTLYALCTKCSEVDVKDKDEYIMWLNRYKPKPVKKIIWKFNSKLRFPDDDKLTDHICAACFSTGTVVKADTIFLEDIPMCKWCFCHYELQEAYLTASERGGLDDYYDDLRVSLRKNGCHVEIVE